MFNAGLPQFFSRPMIRQFKTNRGFELFEFTGSNFNIEIMAFVADFQNFRPCEPINSQTITINQETRSADSQHNVNAFRIFGGMKINTVHCQFFGILQKMQFCLGGCLTFMCPVEFNDLIFKVGCLIRRKLEVFQVISPHRFRIVITKFGLYQIRAQKGVRYKRTR